MADLPAIFDQRADFDPHADLDQFLKGIPARWVVYLLADADDRPVQLLCVRNLRASLARRLGGQELPGLTRRIDYRQIVRRVWWRRADSAFEADWLYFESARQVFPLTYTGLLGFHPAWFVHVDPEAAFPRYVRTRDLRQHGGQLLGPVPDKHAAQRLIQQVEDAFDLCRYYNILTEAPRGRACAYKEMGKCPAPCDGSIAMGSYRLLVERSISALIDPAPLVREQSQRMQQAAAELRFESAAKIKAYVEQLSQFGRDEFRHVRRLGDFAWLSLQRGPRAGTAKVFLITPGRIDLIAGLAAPPQQASDLMRHALELAAEARGAALDQAGEQRVGLVAHHLFQPKASQGAFLRLDELEDRALAQAFRDVQKQKEPPPSEGEGIVKEMDALDAPASPEGA